MGPAEGSGTRRRGPSGLDGKSRRAGTGQPGLRKDREPVPGGRGVLGVAVERRRHRIQPRWQRIELHDVGGPRRLAFQHDQAAAKQRR